MTPNTPIKPGDVRVDPGSLRSAFQNDQAAQEALWIVSYCQNRGNWAPFTMAALRAHWVNRGFMGEVRITSLVRAGYVREQDGHYSLTTQFVELCRWGSTKK